LSRVNIDLLLAAYILDPNNRGKWLTDEAVNVSLKKIGVILLQSKGAGSGSSTETGSAGDGASIDACSWGLKEYLGRMKKYAGQTSRVLEL